MNGLIKRAFCLLLFFTASSAVSAQWKWYNPMDTGYPVIQNQGFTGEISKTYVRLPDRAKGVVRDDVWNLSRNSSGLALHFYSNAPEIKIRYTVSGGFNMPHMPSTGVSGLDLYSINSCGQWRNCSGNYSFSDTVSYYYGIKTKDQFHNRGFEYRLFLPLYNSVKWMEIGVPDGYELEFIPASPEKPIVLYGTSIAQGACASRPAMAWGNILQRSLDYPLINLGFSGNGRLEKEVLDFVSEPDARLYILDCLPNLTNRSELEVDSLVTAAVKQLRKSHPDTPILLVEHAGFSNALTDSTQYNAIERANSGSRKAYEKLSAENTKELYYLSRGELGFPADAWVDYVHPSDLGMQQQAKAVEKKVRQILNIPIGNISTTIPVTQRREPHNYEWQARHRAVLEQISNNPPKSIIIGNSITHFWGGEPEHPNKFGKQSWDEVMRPAGFINLGYGWDRIENALWRVYHGEMDGYKAGKIVVMIGTNNLSENSDAEITAGLQFLLSAIAERQPQAEIKVIGILPRRDMEERVKRLNSQIKSMAEKKGYTFTDAGTLLLTKGGKIDETLFLDGLHPNENGYKKIARKIAE